MSLPQLTNLIPPLITLLVLAIAALAARTRHTLSGIPLLTASLGGVAAIALAHTVELAAQSLELKVVWDSVQLAGLLITAACYLALACHHAGQTPTNGRTAWLWLALFITGLVSLVMVNAFQSLASSEIVLTAEDTLDPARYLPGYLFAAAFACVMGLVGTAQFLLVRHHARSDARYRLQMSPLTIGLLVLGLGLILAVLDRALASHHSVSYAALVIGGLVTTWSLLRFAELDTVPIAWAELVESMSDAVFVIDMQDKLIDLNPAAGLLIDRSVQACVGMAAEDIFSAWPDLLQQHQDLYSAQGEFAVDTSSGTATVDLRISPLRDRFGDLMGRVVVVRDITQRAEADTRLREYQDFLEELIASRTANLQKMNEHLQQEIIEKQRAEEALKQYAERLEVMRQLDRAILVADSAEAIAETALEQIGRLVKCQRQSVTLFDLANNEATIFAAAVDGSSRTNVGEKFDLDDFRISEGLIRGQILVEPDIARKTSPTALELTRLKQDGVHSYVNIPLVTRGKLIGSLNAASTSPHFFEQEHVDILTAAATQLAIALEQARLFEEKEQRLRELTVLHAITVATADTTDENHLLKRAAAIVGDTLYPDLLAVFMLNSESGLLSSLDTGQHPVAVCDGKQCVTGSAVVGHVAATGNPWRITDLHLLRDHLPISPESRSVLCTPLKVDGQILGVINVESTRMAHYTHHDEQLLVTFAGQLATAIKRLRVQTKERQRAAETAALLKTSQLVSTSLDLGEVLDDIASHARLLLQADGSRIHLLDDDSNELTCVISRQGSNGNLDDSAATLDMAYQVADSGEPLIVSSGLPPAGEVNPAAAGSLLELALVPLKMRDKVIGVMTVSRRSQAVAFAEGDVDLLAAFATHAAFAIGNARLYSDLEAALEQEKSAQVQLLQSAKLSAIGQLAATVAHELSNPLQVVHLMLETTVRDGRLADKTRTSLEAALRESHRMAKLVDRLRDTYRPVSKPILEIVQINDLFQHVYQLMENHLRLKKIEVELDLASNLPAIPVISDQVRQVILNLTLNAVEAMPEGGRIITRTGLGSDGGDVWLSITDSGPGIPQEDISRVFEPFFTNKENGTGLGLSVSHNIITQHHGRIEVDSRPGKGTTFTVRLPANGSTA